MEDATSPRTTRRAWRAAEKMCALSIRCHRACKKTMQTMHCGDGPISRQGARYQRVVVDSRERDLRTFPSPSHYELQLDDDLRDVMSLRLVAADVPFAGYTLPASATQLPVTVGAASHVVQMAAGDYASVADLALGLRDALNAATTLPGGFTVTASTRTGTLTIRASTAFAFPAAGRPSTLSRVLGMRRDGDMSAALEDVGSPDYDAVRPYAATTPFRADLSADRYAVLHVTPNAEVLSSTRDSVNRGFAIITGAPAWTSQNLTVGGEDGVYQKTWTPPLGRVARIGIRLLDWDGNLLDTQNRDHRLELLFACQRLPSLYPPPI